MTCISKIVRGLLGAVNGVCVLILLLCACSPYIDPAAHPYLTCCGLAFPILLVVNLLFLVGWLLVRPKMALLPLAALLCCGRAVWLCCPLNFFSGQPPEGAVSFLSYNVMAFDMNKPHTEEAPNEVIEYLRHSDADIICLQEYIVGSRLKREEIDRALSDYPYKHYYRIASGLNGLGCYSRFPILSATPVSYASKANGSIVYELQVGNDTLMVVNNHLESNKLTLDDRATYVEMIKDPEADKVKEGSRKLLGKLAEAVPIRAAQADTIARIVQQRGSRPVVVCGDFNTSPVSYAYRVISRGLQDAFARSGCGFGISYNRNGFYFRIDHILVSPDLRSYRCVVDKSVRGSDHYPIRCWLMRR